MKQIKVPLTHREWAEKRLQLTCHSYELTYHPERFDSLLETCGFYLVEDEEQPETKPNEIPTDKVEAVKYFLNQLPDGYRERALAQVDKKRIKSYHKPVEIVTALTVFAVWKDTKEGEDFWNAVDNHYRFLNEYPTLPPLPNE